MQNEEKARLSCRVYNLREMLKHAFREVVFIGNLDKKYACTHHRLPHQLPPLYFRCTVHYCVSLLLQQVQKLEDEECDSSNLAGCNQIN
ncbi:unnamed protein product [Dovyalis caffra]|uniref:Uncharacterized protein n=1 Tax=Dovyalis caffra TaxID=77055 RepID=A0AAV1QYA7_9ROSI|nr:unnamed protein product [Dovyalis caffra]